MFTILYFPIVNQKLGVSLKVVMGIRSSLCCHVKLESCFYLLRAEKNILG